MEGVSGHGGGDHVERIMLDMPQIVHSASQSNLGEDGLISPSRRLITSFEFVSAKWLGVRS